MSKKWKILNAWDETHLRKSISCLQKVAQINTIAPDAKKISQMLPLYDAYLAPLKVRLSKNLLENCPDLKIIATPSTGTDHLPMSYLKRKGIKVISLRQSPEILKKITSTAELTWGLLLALIRRIPESFESVQAGRWGRDDFIGHQLSGKTLGIIGYGRLGKIVANYGLAFGMRVIAYDFNPSVIVSHGVIKTDLDDLLRTSDVISIHIHLDKQNIGFLGADKMDKMKNGTIVINTSRGAIIDEYALLERLATKRLGGAGVDVIDGEWRNIETHPMVKYARNNNNLLITPHIGGVSYEAQQIAVKHVALRLKKAIKEIDFEHAYSIQ